MKPQINTEKYTDMHRPEAVSVTNPRSSVAHYRWVICALLFFAATINYIDRQVIGILKTTIHDDIGWSEVDYSWVVFSFQAAYAIGLLGVGRLIDRIGTRKGFSLAMIFWSAAAMGHALAHTVFGFGVARFFLGLGEAGNFPAAIKTVAEWFPKKERALATGIFNSGTNIGALVTPFIVQLITFRFGWKTCSVGALLRPMQLIIRRRHNLGFASP